MNIWLSIIAAASVLLAGIAVGMYIRERRIWVWLAPQTNPPEGGEGDALAPGSAARSVSESSGNTQATMALSANRKTMDGDKEFEMLKTKLLQAPQ